MKKDTLVIALLVLFISCGNDDASAPSINNEPIGVLPIDLSESWQTASASSQNVSDLSNAIEAASAHPRMTSLLVVRHGKLISESYFDGNGLSDLQDVRSVTKSVLSALVGIAIENGFITSIDDLIEPYLEDTAFTLSSEQSAITIKHLLTMSAGFEWDEWNTNIYGQWITSGEPVNFLLDKPIVTVPGESFSYNSASTHLLGVVLSEAVGMSIEDFANSYLFNHLNINAVNWEFFNDGSINGGSGIDLRPRDLAKFGQLFLQHGVSANEQVIPQGWISSCISPSFDWRFNFGALTNYTYGKLWWTRDTTSNNAEAYLAWGFGGQYIYVVPGKNLVVVTTTNWVNSSAAGGSSALEQEALNVIINEILPQVN